MELASSELDMPFFVHPPPSGRRKTKVISYWHFTDDSHQESRAAARPYSSLFLIRLALLCCLIITPGGVEGYCVERDSCRGSTPYYHYETGNWCCFMWTCFCSYCCDYPRHRPSPPPPAPPPPPASTCRGTTYLNGSSGSFADGSSTYSNYGHDMTCYWLIQPGYSGIRLTFSRFDTERDHDYVTIYDGAYSTSPILGKFAGSSLPGTIIGTSSSMLVHFQTDESSAATGFAASYQRNVQASTCSGTTYLTSGTGSFSDGSSVTSTYSNNLNCRWLIQPGYSPIKLTFARFSTEPTYDPVMIYDGSSTSSVLLGTFSGNTLPSPLQTTGSSMLVVFTSDSTQERTGFFASYEQPATTCNGRVSLTSATGSFTDGSVPSMPYANNKQCSWLIDPGYAPIRLSFSRFRTEEAHDFVKVYNSSIASDQNLLASLSGTSIPGDIVTPGSVGGSMASHQMLVVFTTSSTITDTGFQASYQQAERSCWGVVFMSTQRGTITDGSVAEGTYTRGNICQWVITPGYNGIRLLFSRFSVQGPGDVVRFYSSQSLSPSTEIGTASNMEIMEWKTDDRVVVHSPTNTLVVVFISSLQPEQTTWSTGFEGEYRQATQGHEACLSSRRTYTARTGNFSDGSQALELYSSFLDCEWLISPGTGPIRLSFLRLDTEQDVDVVNVYDGSNAAPSNLLGRFSGSVLPPEPVVSTSTSMLLTFSTNARRSGQGFEVVYSIPCVVNGVQRFEGESTSTKLYTVGRVPYGQTCEQYSYTETRICRSGQMVTAQNVGGRTRSLAVGNEKCDVAQCPEVVMRPESEGWVHNNLNAPHDKILAQPYQGGLQCSWALWPGAGTSSTLSLARRSIPSSSDLKVALLVTSMNTSAGKDIVQIHKAAPADDPSVLVRNQLVSELSGHYGSKTAILVSGTPAVVIGFATDANSGSGHTGWEIGYSTVSTRCSFQVSFRF